MDGWLIRNTIASLLIIIWTKKEIIKENGLSALRRKYVLLGNLQFN